MRSAIMNTFYYGSITSSTLDDSSKPFRLIVKKSLFRQISDPLGEEQQPCSKMSYSMTMVPLCAHFYSE